MVTPREPVRPRAIVPVKWPRIKVEQGRLAARRRPLDEAGTDGANHAGNADMPAV